ncbi:hypothetical protein HDU98_002579 [Podochytrium sp. JEL0797]|nr:hypothetical protein HDU98_002579 [Podochytrium sp. JEL0797]
MTINEYIMTINDVQVYRAKKARFSMVEGLNTTGANMDPIGEVFRDYATVDREFYIRVAPVSFGNVQGCGDCGGGEFWEGDGAHMIVSSPLSSTPPPIPGFVSAVLSPTGINLAQLLDNPQHSDVLLAFQDNTTVHAHAAILCLHSTWFSHNIPSSDARTTQCVVCEFGDTSAETGRLVLRFLYTGQVKVPESRVLEVMRFAWVLDIRRLVEICVDVFERRLLTPETCVAYARFLFDVKARDLEECVGVDVAAGMDKVAQCLRKDVGVAVAGREGRLLMKGFSGDQVCDLCALVKEASPVVVWTLCLAWIWAVHGEETIRGFRSSSDTLVHDGEEVTDTGVEDIKSVCQDDCVTQQLSHTLIPDINLPSAKEDLSDLLFILDLHSFTLQEYSTHVLPHLALFPPKTRQRIETHYAKEHTLLQTRKQSLGSLFDSTQIMTHAQSQRVVARITGCQAAVVGGATTRLKLIYTASAHGFSNAKFHSVCNHRGPTLVVVQLVSEEVVGGFVDKSWSSDSVFHSSQNAFLFSCDKAGDGDVRFFGVAEKKYSILGSMCEAVYFGQKDLAVDGKVCCSCLTAYQSEEGGGRKLLERGDFVDVGVLEYQVFSTLLDNDEESDD